MRRRLTRGREGGYFLERVGMMVRYMTWAPWICKCAGGRGGGRREDGHVTTTEEDSSRYRGDVISEMQLIS